MKAGRDHLPPSTGSCDPGGPGEDDSGGFAHGGWSVNYWDERMGQIMGEAMSSPFDLVLGRTTYDIFAAYWPNAPGRARQALNEATKYVASRGHPALGWSRSVLIEGTPPTASRRSSRRGPGWQVHGSGNLIQTLLRRGSSTCTAVGLPPGHRVGQTAARRRHLPLRPEARRQQGLHHRGRDWYLRARGRDRHRIVRTGLTRSRPHRRIPRRPVDGRVVRPRPGDLALVGRRYAFGHGH